MAIALVLGVASCSADDDEKAFSGKKVDFDNSYVFISDSDSTDIKHADSATDSKKGYTVKANNTTDTGYYYRAFKPLAQKHYGSTCVITITPQTDGISYSDSDSATNSAINGVAGFVFDRTDDKSDNTYSFLLAAVRYDASKKQVGTYISKYTNALVKDNNYTQKSNFTDVNGTEITTTANSTTSAQETVIVNGSTSGSTDTGSTVYYGFKTTDFEADTDGNIVVVVKVEQDETTGAYTVSYYKSLENSQDETVTPVAKFDVSSDKKVLSGYTQGKMAMYANIYPGQHFYADFAFKDTVGNDIPFEDEVIEE